MSIPTKSVILNSHRGSKPKVDPIKVPAQSHTVTANHSRYSQSYTGSTASVALQALQCHAVHILINRQGKAKI